MNRYLLVFERCQGDRYLTNARNLHAISLNLLEKNVGFGIRRTKVRLELDLIHFCAQIKCFSRLIIGESLFTLFASLTYICLSLSDDANKIKTLNIERA